ncbi:MAG: outer membrane protein assembly factor BamB [Alteromonadaceae bacterium]|nr:outer membrane protein assembly factor BamB [Alteromonadaceae bacterium]
MFGSSVRRVFCSAAVATLVLGVVGCSSREPFEEPAPLPEIETTVELKEEWSRSVGDGMDGDLLFLSPTIVNDTLYAVAAEGELYAFEADSGAEIWRRDLDRSILGGVGADRKQLYVASRDGVLVAVNQETGEPVWTVPLPSEVLAPPQSNGDQVVVSTIDGKLIAYNTSDGQRIWQYDSSAPVLSYRGTATPYVDSERVLGAFSNGMLISVDVRTGAPLWEYAVGIPSGRTELERLVDVDGAPLVLGESVLVAGYQGQLAALSLDTGQELWSREASSLQSPGVGQESIFVSEADGTVISYNAFSRAEAWRVGSLSWRRLTTPVGYKDLVAVGDYEGYLHLIRQSDGALVGREEVDDEGLRVSPLPYRDKLIVFGNGGKLAAYSLQEPD